MSDLFLDEDELVTLTGLRMKSRQVAWLKAAGLRHFVNANGRPAVPRAAYEDWKDPPPPPAPAVAPWVPPLPPPWEETPLGRWQAEQAVARIQREKDQAEGRREREAEMEACRPAREAAAKVQRAALVRFHANRRRVTKLQRTPAWADQDAIRAIYLRAQQLTAESGVPHHVDHEIPLQGKLVSGLHVHNNLQVITGSENSRKRNRYEVA